MLNDALRAYGNQPYWAPEWREQFENISDLIKGRIEHLEKPAKEEEILTKAAAILRGRGITEWTP